MTSFVAVALFLVGVYLAMRGIAALYRIIDLWYAIGREYALVIRGLVGWGGAIALVVVLAGQEQRAAFLWGLVGYAVFYLGLYGLRNLAMRR